MTPIERLQTSLTTLGLKAVEARLEKSVRTGCPERARLCRIPRRVAELRSGRTAARATCERACSWRTFPFVKTFEQFDFGFQPSIDEKQIPRVANSALRA